MSGPSTSITALLGTLLNHSGLKRFVVHIVKGKDAADDVVQQLAETVLNKPVTPEQPEHYLFRAARNTAINSLRADTRRSHYEAQCSEHVGFEDVRCPERILEGQQQLTQLQMALDELPELTQEIFLKFNLEGMSQRQIADHFGLHLSTVEKRLARAKRHCASKLMSHED